MPFVKGQSGNPAGRRKEHGDIRELARAKTGDALKALVQVATKGKSESARVSAATALLDRAYGKPPQSHEMSGPGGAPIAIADLSRLSNEQLATLETVFGPLAGSGGDDEGDPGGEGSAAG
ncbi:DUF5681 domain-containing protein [Methylorubrum extorquens]|uniref:DUF5681 domain-containing protein n=1 Tax=Methylorubrum extorquens TaxID=408 RepID=UPI003F5E715B